MVRNGYYTWVLLFTTFTAYCACASLGATSGASKFGSGLGLGSGQYQTWREWAKKRSFGTSSRAAPWTRSPFTADDFQDWREYMNKRGFHIPDSQQSHQQFQSWLEWSKRQQHEDAALGASGRENPFPNPQNFGKFGGTFQNWGDWYAKRSGSPFASHGSAVFGGMGATPAVGGGMQSWDEFMKRKGFGFAGPAQTLGYPQAAGLQSWSEWAKRFGPINTSNGVWGDFGPGGFGYGNKQQYTDWQSHFQHSADKRQLGYRPHRFGSFHRYFTDGLQDWRSTFKGSKRTSDNEGNNLEQGSSDMSHKEQGQ